MIGLGVRRSFRGSMRCPVSRNKSFAERLIYKINWYNNTLGRTNRIVLASFYCITKWKAFKIICECLKSCGYLRDQSGRENLPNNVTTCITKTCPSSHVLQSYKRSNPPSVPSHQGPPSHLGYPVLVWIGSAMLLLFTLHAFHPSSL